ncbi:MAG: hypothetical protein IPH84_18315 [Bacteroidales bacterium]|nr:hypothetical protein [Bacteroidales bacterium]
MGAGAWSIVSGGTGAFDDNTDPNATFTAYAYGAYVLRWTISNGVCTASTADMNVTFFASPVVSNAGPAQNLCDVTNTTSRRYDPTPVQVSGRLSQVLTPWPSLPDSIQLPVTSMVPGVYVFKWTISNGVCLLQKALLPILTTLHLQLLFRC